MDKKLKSELMAIVGEQSFTDQIIDRVSFSYDASEFHHRPDCAVWVETASQVSEVLALANRNRTPVTPRGAGTGLCGMAVPIKGGIVLDMTRMNKILSVDIDDRLVVVQPGVIYAELERVLALHGYFFPPDPSSGAVSTLGGNVATNAGGMKGAKYGTTRDYVLALEVVLPEGRIIRTGAKTMKSVSGYNLTQLFVGSEGTLGVITEITLKINPRPPVRSTAMAAFATLEDTGRAVTQVMRSGILPSVLDFIDRSTLRAINQNTDLNLPADAAALLLAETDGWTGAETRFQMEKILVVFRENNATEITEASTEAETLALWRARKSGYGVMARINTNLLVEDLCVPISKTTEMLKAIDTLSKKYGMTIPTVGHAGDGNLHPTISFSCCDPAQVRNVEAASAELMGKVIELGGTLTAEHGIGLSKAPFMHLEHGTGAMDLMRAVKRLLDPKDILNPGKMALEM